MRVCPQCGTEMVSWGSTARTLRWRCPACNQIRRKTYHDLTASEADSRQREAELPTQPWLQDPDVTIYQGDCLKVLPQLPERSIHMCVTSPPYYGLRDYGAEGQVGLEETPTAYVEKLVEVMRQVRRVLRDDGTLWLNLGATYAAARSYQVPDSKHRDVGNTMSGRVPHGFKAKDLIPIPWMVALALQADGWYLRADIIWAKGNPLPESVTDRPTQAHEYIFLLSKQSSYFFDQEPLRTRYRYDGRRVTHVQGKEGSIQHRGGERWPGIGNAHHQARAETTMFGQPETDPMDINHSGANIRTVWQINSEPFPGAHFAVFPTEIPRRAILAGTPEIGVCSECGTPWLRVDDDGWRPGCHHVDAPPRPAVVIDPFGGSGTTGLVARNHGRHAVLIELNETYAKIAAERLQQLSLLTS